MPKVENSLPPGNLTRYNDSFDTLREDVWAKIGHLLKADQRAAYFQLADVRTEGGRLRVETKTGRFSSGGLGPKIRFRGDFDIQLDAQVEFMEDVHDMDQVMSLYALDKTNELEDEKLQFAAIGVVKEAQKPAILYSAYQEKGTWTGLNGIEINHFRGTFRVIRIGKIFTTLYKNEGDAEWRRVGTVSRTTHEIVIILIAQNYVAARTSVGATKPFTASFDNFKVNAAQNIQESEI